jgi:hypothetical protein
VYHTLLVQETLNSWPAQEISRRCWHCRRSKSAVAGNQPAAASTRFYRKYQLRQLPDDTIIIAVYADSIISFGPPAVRLGARADFVLRLIPYEATNHISISGTPPGYH